MQEKGWDVSVKSLVAFPQVVKQMSDQLEWTQKLGDAMLAQHADVAASIQRLRARANAAGTLKTSAQQKVIVEPTPAANGATSQTIVIQPADPQVVYVPVYQPGVVYGAWPYPAYLPYYYPPYPGYGYGAAFVGGFIWGAAIAGGGSLHGGWGWPSPGTTSDINAANQPRARRSVLAAGITAISLTDTPLPSDKVHPAAQSHRLRRGPWLPAPPSRRRRSICLRRPASTCRP